MRIVVRFRNLLMGLAKDSRAHVTPQNPFRSIFKFVTLAVCALITLGFFTRVDAFAATISAASCNAADVQTALNRAASGDTVSIPAGTCRWTTSVTWNAPPNVILKGAGSTSVVGGNDQTVIIDNYRPNAADVYHTAGPLLTIVPNATGTFRMQGITIKGDRDNSNYKYALVLVAGQSKQFRVDHVHVDLTNAVYPSLNYAVPTAFEFYGYVTGVIDHSLFNFADRGGAFIVHYNNYGGGAEGDEAWAAPSGLGTSDFLFFEDNKITNMGSGATVNDCYHAGKWVIRFNDIQGASIGQTHPTGGSGRARGCRAFEAYMNRPTVGANGTAQFNAFFISSGTGMIWGHNAPVGYSNWITLHSMRFDTRTYTQQPTPTGWGKYPSVYDANGAAMDQPGRGQGDLLANPFPGVRNMATNCDASQPCIQPRQKFEPVYEWKNVWSTAGGGARMAVYEPDVLVADRDYVVENLNFNGTSGVGSGTLAARPATCTTGVFYWATDQGNWNSSGIGGQGVGYKCVSTNTWQVYYTPYTYPHPLVAGAVAAAIGDSNGPNPGNGGTLASSVVGNSATIVWTKATDDQTLQPALQYEVRLSTNNDIDTITKAEAYGAIVVPYATDINSAVVPGLTAGATYFFNVIVRDQAGNKSIYVPTSVTAAVPDGTAPMPGNGGTIITSNVGSSSATLNWTRATDDISSQSQLLYEVRRSTTNNIDTVLRAEAYGSIVQAYSPNISSALMTGLTPETTYYFNVIVRDAAGNRAAYVPKSVTTTPFVDTANPLPGNGGVISTLVGPTETTLSWIRATDNASTQAQLLYEVRRSLVNNVDTVARAEANGTIVRDYTSDLTSVVATGLDAGTTYYFNVIVKDAAGNKAQYQSASVTTAADRTPPVPGNLGRMTSSSTQSSVTISWTKAVDNVSPQPALRYEVRLSTGNNINSVAAAESNGTLVKPYTSDLTTFVANGLNSGTDYYLNVIVKDEANNKAVYVAKAESTSGRKFTQLNSNDRGPGWRNDTPSIQSFAAPSSDTTSPIPGSAGLIAVSGISQSGLTLRWTTATDDTTLKASLRYQVVESSAKNINTVAQAESNGNVLQAYSTDLSSFQVRGISNAVQHFFTVIVVDAAGNKAVYGTAGNLGETYSYLTNGGMSFSTLSAPSSSLRVHQLQVTPGQSTGSPAGLAIVRSTGSRGVMSTAGLPLSGGIRAGSLYADLNAATEMSEAVRTGIAFANPSTQDAQISFFFTDANGVEIKSGIYTLLANHQISGFLDESPFNGPSAFSGTFTFAASAPISAIGTRSLTRRNGEFLLQSLPVAQGTSSGSNAFLPAFVDGGGWSTAVVLTNNSSAQQVGRVQFWGHGSPGVPATVVEMTVNGVTASSFNYSLPPRSVVKLVTAGASPEMNTGSIRVTTTGALTSGGVPDAVALITSRNDSGTVSQASMAALSTGTAFRMYVETSADPQWVSSSVAIVNSSDNPNTLNLTLTKLDGTPVTSTSVTLPPNGQISRFIVDIFPGLESGFKGLLRVTSSAPVGFTGFRCMTNTAGDFLFASTPPQNEMASLPSGGLAFPLIASGAGYDTQVILFGESGQAGTGDLLFVSKDGVPQTASGLGVAP